MMKLVQKILSHGLFIAFVVAAFFLYTKRAELFPQWFAKAEAPATVAANEQPSTAPVREVDRPKPEKVISKQPVAPLPEAQTEDSAAPETAGSSDSVAPSEAQPDSAAPAPVEPQVAAAPDTQPGDAPAAAPQVQEPSAPVAEATTTAGVAASAAGTESTADTGPAGEAAPPQSAEAGAQQLQQQLAQARALYWRKDTDGAALIYQSLSQAHPENPDVWGEAGNFYYSLQQREQAVDAYSHAFDLLMRQGEQQRASQLLGVMHQLDEEKARALEMQLQQPGG